MPIYAPSTAGIPYLILDILVDTLIRDRGAIAVDAVEYKGSSHYYLHGSSGCKTFWNMTLVHRTWTSVARRGLWYRAVLNGRDLKTVKHDLGRCQQLRELAITLNVDADTQEGLLSSFLQQSINIRTFYVDILEERQKEAEHLLGQLSTLSKLERLWIMGATQTCMGQICAAVLEMQNLKSLVLDYSSDIFSGVQSPDGMGPPPEKLRSVAILEPLDWPHVAWLLQPHRNDGVSDLAISLEHAGQLEESPELASQFHECLPRLKSLHMLTSNAATYNADYLQTDVLNSLLSKATNLQCLMLSVNKVHVNRLHLPESVTQLHIHKVLYISNFSNPYYRKEFSDDDSSVSSILAGLSSSSSSPCRLSALVISVFRKGDLTASELDVLTTSFTRTHAICRDIQIALTFETRGCPYVGGIAEDPVFAD